MHRDGHCHETMVWYRPLEDVVACSPTLEESYRKATTQRPIMGRRLTRISRSSTCPMVSLSSSLVARSTSGPNTHVSKGGATMWTGLVSLCCHVTLVLLLSTVSCCGGVLARLLGDPVLSRQYRTERRIGAQMTRG